MTDAQLLADIRRCFPDFAVDSWRPLGEGWMSRALLVNESYVFRFAKHVQASADLAKEVVLLPTIADHVTLTVPRFELVGEQGSGLGFVGYRAIVGEPLDSALLSELAPRARQLVVAQLALFMGELHAVPRALVERAGLHPVDLRAEYTQDREALASCRAPLPTHVAGYVEQRFAEFLENDAHFEYEPRLIHADLSPEHLLVDRGEQRLVGVIDFGDLSLSDSDYEYLYLLEDLGIELTRAVMVARGEANVPALLRKVGYFVTFDHVHSLLSGLSHGKPEWLEEGVAELAHEAERVNSS